MEQLFKGLLFLLRPLLYPLSLIYGAVVWFRNKIYDNDIYSSIEFSVPVISVGNLSTGGTGKTPHIEYLIRLLQYEFKVATMSRGYKRRTSGFILADKEKDTALTIGDEPMQFLQHFQEAYVSVCNDRMAGIPDLLSERPDVEVVLLDDAFQHRSVKAGINILIMDYSRPFYEDHILPFGRLRESRSGYKRANIIIVSKCPKDCSSSDQKAIIHNIDPLPQQQVFFTTVDYLAFYDFFTNQPVQLAKTSHLVLVSGIANPEPMLHYLRGKAEFVHLLQYPDHHYYSERDLDEMEATIKGWEAENKAIVLSEKDAARLSLNKDKLAQWQVAIYVLPIQIQFINQATEFEQIIKNYIYKEREGNYIFENN